MLRRGGTDGAASPRQYRPPPPSSTGRRHSRRRPRVTMPAGIALLTWPHYEDPEPRGCLPTSGACAPPLPNPTEGRTACPAQHPTATAWRVRRPDCDAECRRRHADVLQPTAEEGLDYRHLPLLLEDIDGDPLRRYAGASRASLRPQRPLEHEQICQTSRGDACPRPHTHLPHP